MAFLSVDEFFRTLHDLFETSIFDISIPQDACGNLLYFGVLSSADEFFIIFYNLFNDILKTSVFDIFTARRLRLCATLTRLLMNYPECSITFSISTGVAQSHIRVAVIEHSLVFFISGGNLVRKISSGFNFSVCGDRYLLSYVGPVFLFYR